MNDSTGAHTGILEAHLLEAHTRVNYLEAELDRTRKKVKANDSSKRLEQEIEMLRAKLRDAERQLAAVGSAEDNMRVQKDLRDARAAITTLEDRITELQHVCTVLSLY